MGEPHRKARPRTSIGSAKGAPRKEEAKSAPCHASPIRSLNILLTHKKVNMSYSQVDWVLWHGWLSSRQPVFSDSISHLVFLQVSRFRGSQARSEQGSEFIEIRLCKTYLFPNLVTFWQLMRRLQHLRALDVQWTDTPARLAAKQWHDTRRWR